MRTRSVLVTSALVAVLALAGCASQEDADGGSTPDPTPTGSPSPTASDGTPTVPTEAPGTTVEVTISGSDVTPNGKTVEVDRGEDVTFSITSDAPGELHFHSTPEQQIQFAAGTSSHTVRFDRPGVVEVESHELEKVVVKLEVS